MPRGAALVHRESVVPDLMVVGYSGADLRFETPETQVEKDAPNQRYSLVVHLVHETCDFGGPAAPVPDG